jgi:hypothetical protein
VSHAEKNHGVSDAFGRVTRRAGFECARKFQPVCRGDDCEGRSDPRQSHLLHLPRLPWGVPGYKNAYPNYSVPELKGQHPEYIVSALKAYKSGER